MSFFSSDPNQQQPQQQEQPKPLFQEPFAARDKDSHVSLSAYISKHFQEEGKKENDTPAPPRTFLSPAAASTYTPEESPGGKQGHHLNQVDVEFTAGLEQYMPTPLFRLRVTKKRLDIEISELKMRLNKYERLLNTGVAPKADDLAERMRHLRERIGVLETHDRQVSLELQALMTYGPAFYTLTKGLQKFQAAADTMLDGLQQGLKKVFFGEAKLEIETKGQELRTLHELLSERMADKNSAPGEISQLINQYEQTIREMEQLTAHLHQGPGFLKFLK